MFISKSISLNLIKRSYAVSAILSKEVAATNANAAGMVLNFCAPHGPIYANKIVDKVIIPGESGEYGVTVGHSPIISQLKPGVVSVVHVGGEIEKYFVSGGFALTNANSVTDISVTEAVAVSDLDEAAIKSGYAEAVKVAGSAADGTIAKAEAQIEVNVYSALARAVGVAV